MRVEVPIVSLRGLAEGDPRALERVAAELRPACETLGAFHVIDHGIAEEDLAALEAAMRGFFALPAEEKRKTLRSRDNAWGYYDEELTKNRPDWKEVAQPLARGAARAEARAAAAPRSLRRCGEGPAPGDLHEPRPRARPPRRLLRG
jgi:isopenicillin N synthase-like dioxygenase